MKLRVKLVAAPSIGPYRVEANTAGELRAAVRAVVPGLDDADLSLSLDKKNPLALNDDGVTLASVGLCGGDCVWILYAAPAQVGPASTAAAQGSSQGLATASASTSRSNAPVSASLAAEPVCVHPQAKAPPCQPDTEAAGDDGGEGSHPKSMDSVEAIDTSKALSMPLALQRLCAAAAACGRAPPASPTLLSICASPLHHTALVVHAAMMESGFCAMGPTANSLGLGAWVQVGPGTLSAAYSCLQGPSARQARAADATSGSMEVDSEAQPAEVVLTVTGMAHYMVLTGRVLQTQLPAAAAAAAAGAPPAATSSSAAAATAAGVVRPKAVHLSLDAQDIFTREALQAETQAAGVFGGVAPVTGSSFSDLPSLWRRLKDHLALPLLVAAHTSAGLPSPLGLLTLPAELLLNVMEHLGVPELSALACTSSSLHAWAGEDELWQRLFGREFPNATARDKERGGTQGWRAALRACWEERKRARKRRGVMLPPPLPFPVPMGGGPARGPLIYPSRIIGGDYDRLPGGGMLMQLPPGMGGAGGGGVMGFGGVGGSGSMGGAMGGPGLAGGLGLGGIGMGPGGMVGPGMGPGMGPRGGAGHPFGGRGPGRLY